MKIDIDPKSGFCRGVIRAITKAEQSLEEGERLYCLGDIVHNSEEVLRLEKKGLITIDYDQFLQLHDATVLFRAHGEPPEIYDIAHKNNLTIIDASCGVVLSLQQRIKKAKEEFPNHQIVIFGKKGHAEVVGLEGQIGYKAIVVENVQDLDKIDFEHSIILFSQTTKSIEEFRNIIQHIRQKISKTADFQFFDTICRQVSNRIPELKLFASNYETIIFVSGKNSSNGKVLFEVCRSVNPNTMFVSSPSDIDFDMIRTTHSIGICGATSTPIWLMQNIKEKIYTFLAKNSIL